LPNTTHSLTTVFPRLLFLHILDGPSKPVDLIIDPHKSAVSQYDQLIQRRFGRDDGVKATLISRSLVLLIRGSVGCQPTTYWACLHHDTTPMLFTLIGNRVASLSCRVLGQGLHSLLAIPRSASPLTWLTANQGTRKTTNRARPFLKGPPACLHWPP